MSEACNLTHVFKRDGTYVPYSRKRISNAIYRAAVAVGGRDKEGHRRRQNDADQKALYGLDSQVVCVPARTHSQGSTDNEGGIQPFILRSSPATSTLVHPKIPDDQPG